MHMAHKTGNTFLKAKLWICLADFGWLHRWLKNKIFYESWFFVLLYIFHSISSSRQNITNSQDLARLMLTQKPLQLYMLYLQAFKYTQKKKIYICDIISRGNFHFNLVVLICTSVFINLLRLCCGKGSSNRIYSVMKYAQCFSCC